MEKLRLEVPVLLPEEDCPRCLGQLQEALHAHKGVTRVHVDGSGASARLCLHYDPALITAQHVEEQARRAGLTITERYGHLNLPIEGLDCADCAQTLEEGIRRLPGVLHASVAFLAGKLAVEHDREAVTPEQIEAAVQQLGYRVSQTGDTWRFRVEGMDCADCALTVEKGVASLTGVRQVRLSFSTGRLEVEAADDPSLQRTIEARVGQLGYRAQFEEGAVGVAPLPESGVLRFLSRTSTARWALGSALFLVLGIVFSLLKLPSWVPPAAFAGAIIVGGVPVARAGWAALWLTRSLDMNVLMTLAAIGAMAVGEWAEGAVTIFLFAVGELLERYTMERARGAIRALMDLSPPEAIRVREEGEEQVPVKGLEIGDQIRVPPGQRIPVDGEVTEGHSAVDQAAITGESLPIEKAPGDKVFAGTLNGESSLLIQVTRAARDSTLARIIALVEDAQSRKAPAQRFVDRFARIYTPAVVAGALLVAVLPPLLTGALFSTWVYRALVLLVIACPCALVLSTPVSIASAIAAAARQGVLIKGGAYLEALGRLRALALDKTGTLTEGRPAVTTIISYNERSEEEVLQTAAAVEAGSTHPLAQAVLHEARHRGLTPPPAEEFAALFGRGASAVIDGARFYVGNHTFFEAWGHPEAICQEIAELEASGQTAILVGTEAEVWGVLALADRLRPRARAVVEELRRAGLERVVLLTGDNRPTAEVIAQEAGVDDVRANLLPEQKVDAVESLLHRFEAVGMVGDGVNDAPALARATVGVAMGAIGSDAALETADVALMSDDLTRLPWAIRLGRNTRRVVAQNVVFSLGLKALFLGLAVAGWATLWMAVFADMGASLLVTFNGMRLLLAGRRTADAETP
jgi:Cd2+/Zn2+-exporting ATPase